MADLADQAVGRAVGPFIISWLFSLSTHAASPYSFGRHVVWLLFIALCMPSVWLASKMDQADSNHKQEHGPDEEEERHELMGRSDQLER